jgi:hypothetical protein
MNTKTQEEINKSKGRPGRKHTPEHNAAKAAGIKRAYAAGKYSTPANLTIRKNSRSVGGSKMKGRPADKSHMTRMRMSVNNELRIQRVREVICGTNGIGRQHVGRRDHGAAKRWTIQSPEGEIYEFHNLREWLRQNSHRLEGLGLRTAKRSFWERAHHGLTQSFRYGSNGGWFGWKIIKIEDMDLDEAISEQSRE